MLLPMNVRVTQMNVRVTRSSDGLTRRAFTVQDLDRMVEAGIVGPDERIEVFHGNLLPMNAKGPLHETIKQHLTIHFVRHLLAEATFIQEAGWRIVDTLYLEPDYLFFPRPSTSRPSVGPTRCWWWRSPTAPSDTIPGSRPAPTPRSGCETTG